MSHCPLSDSQIISHHSYVPFQMTSHQPAPMSALAHIDVRRHKVCELSGVDDVGCDWIGYFNLTTSRAALWSLRKSHADRRNGHFIADWQRCASPKFKALRREARRGNLEVEEFLVATLPDWFWEKQPLNPDIDHKAFTGIYRKAFLLNTRQAILNVALSTLSIVTTIALTYACVAFWFGGLQLVL